MKNKIFFSIIAILIIIAVRISLDTKASFEDDLSIDHIDKHYDYSVRLHTDILENPYFENSLVDFEELVDSSELVVKAKMNKSREKVAQATLTEIHVEEVLKGRIQTNEILLYEPAYFWPYIDDPSTGTYATGGYQLMQEGDEYILFLQSLKGPKEYKLSEEEKKSYLPVSELYGKIPIKSNWTPAVIADDDVAYREVVNNDILTREKDLLLNYIKIKKIVEEKYQ